MVYHNTYVYTDSSFDSSFFLVVICAHMVLIGSTGTDAAIWDITTQEPHVGDVLPWHHHESSYGHVPHFAGLRNAASVVLNDNWIVIGGSFPPSNNDPYAHQLSSLVHAYSPLSESWTSLPSISSHRECMAATVLNNKIYVSGNSYHMNIAVDTHKRTHPLYVVSISV